MVKEATTPVQSQTVFEAQKKKALRFRAEPISERKKRLRALREWIHSNRVSIETALAQDLHKPAVEADAIEIFHVLNEIKLAIDELDDWAEPVKIDAPITMLGTRSVIQFEPKGVCLIISPWNYPFSLAVGPLVSALAAGNTAIIKPSEFTVNTSALIARMTREIYPSDEVTVIEGGVDISQHLLELPFDHIFFTGSPGVGKVVMRAAAENLTSVTLELGGKSPCIVCADANLKEAAERIVIGKFVNNGQTCIAPDYILAERSVLGDLSEELIKAVTLRFGDPSGFAASKSYCRIVNKKNHQRLVSLVDDALKSGAKILFSGNHDEEKLFFHPVILTELSFGARLMREEIFGPVLPIIPYDSIDEAIEMINGKAKPLALYIFSQNKRTRSKILMNTTAGGVCVNDVGLHFLNHNLPFGGVNNSGMGKSHGRFGFLAFSNEKPVMKQKSGFTSVKLFYPPYTTTSRKIMDWFLKMF